MSVRLFVQIFCSSDEPPQAQSAAPLPARLSTASQPLGKCLTNMDGA